MFCNIVGYTFFKSNTALLSIVYMQSFVAVIYLFIYFLPPPLLNEEFCYRVLIAFAIHRNASYLNPCILMWMASPGFCHYTTLIKHQATVKVQTQCYRLFVVCLSLAWMFSTCTFMYWFVDVSVFACVASCEFALHKNSLILSLHLNTWSWPPL